MLSRVGRHVEYYLPGRWMLCTQHLSSHARLHNFRASLVVTFEFTTFLFAHRSRIGLRAAVEPKIFQSRAKVKDLDN